MTSEMSLAGIGVEIGGGGVLGFMTGWGTKKLAKIVLKVVGALVGIQVAIFKAAEHYGVITVDWTRLFELMPSGMASTALAKTNDSLMVLANTVPAGSGFAIGMAAGLKKA